ncbi:uncharacterized protein LOC132543961 [Ylistrum balloti]|uniref:uncharacterized protein LOC132543961 n=1 Tax=Ylistrum balloti TaxID=509963 RepID=UPI002905CD67|nr:uncharacterized protein LOC132543961 [Ylistrum balloti]
MSKGGDPSKDGATIKATKIHKETKKVTQASSVTPALPVISLPITELPTAGKLEFQPSPIHVMSMNAGGPSDGKGSAKIRREYFAGVVLDNEPEIFLIQEFRWQGIRGDVWKDTPLPDRYEYTGNMEASIMYDSKRFRLTELSQTKLQAPLDELKRKGKVSQDFTPIARSCVRRLEIKDPLSTEAFRVLVVSWHGIHSRTNEAEKKTQFRYLQIYMKELSEREEAVVLLGGDFNIRIDRIRSLVDPGEFILYEYQPSKRRKGNIIDYFMASPALSLTDVKYINLAEIRKLTSHDPYKVLDHDPISAVMTKKKGTNESMIPPPKISVQNTLLATGRAN